MQVRIKVRIPMLGIETEKFLVGTGPLDKVLFQLAITMLIVGFDLEVAVK